MELFPEIAQLAANRAGLYGLLARLYESEVDAELLAQMAGAELGVETGEPELGDGYRMLSDYLAHLGPNAVTDLAVDYARVLLGAGIIGDRAAYPYESVYTSPDHLIMQDARDEVLALYREEGLDKSEELDVPEDHVGLELEFMAHLCRKTQEALLQNDGSAAAAAVAKQKAFLEGHLLRWVPAFCSDILTYAETDFYKAIARITRGYLQMEQALIGELIEEGLSVDQ